MKTAYLLAFAALSALLLSTYSVKATNYTNYGNTTGYYLNSGDTLRIVSGTYTGAIAQLSQGGVIIIENNAVFSPVTLNMWAPAGKIINNGTANFKNMGIGGGFEMINNKTASVAGSMSFYNGGVKKITNNTGAVLTINGSMNADDYTAIKNSGTIITTGNINLNQPTSTLENTGLMTVGGSLSSNGEITNTNIIRVGQNFNYWNGTLSNTGAITPEGSFSISPGMTYTNNCRLITKGAINNNGTLINNGLVWAGTTNTSADKITNAGTIINGGNAKIRMVDFTNYGNVTGGGFVYTSGATLLGSGASLGVNSVTSDTIRFYDATRTNATRFFDTQWGTIMPNAKFEWFAAPDSIEMPAGCSEVYKGMASIALPVKFNYFYVKLENNEPVLNWSAEFEQDMQFEIQRSYKNGFSTIARVISNNTAAYSYTDKDADLSSSEIMYRIKGTSAIDGAVKYTTVQIIKGNEKKIAISVYPNPSMGETNVSYTSEQAEVVMIRIKAINGQQLFLRNFKAEKGANRFVLNETKNLQSGIYFIEMIKGNEIIASEKFIRR